MTEAKIYAAISEVMKDIGAVGKNSKNEYDKYMFRGIDAVMNALNPAMIKHHVFAVPTVLDAQREERQSKGGGTMMYSVLTVKYTFYTDDGSYIDAVVVGEAMDRSDKSTNKAMSAAYKYACFQTFCIPTEEMKDPDQESPEIGEKSDEQKNREMAESADPDLVPHNEGMTEARIARVKQELERTGIDEKVILNVAKVKSIEEMSEASYIAILNKFKRTPDKKK